MASSYSQSPNVIVLGGGPSGITTAHKLKCSLGFDDFLVYEKLSSLGGTWMANTYPGCGCDIESHLYSFSFNLNPNWSGSLVGQAEILQYMNDTVDKFGLREHFCFNTKCISAKWSTDKTCWEVRFRDTRTGNEFTRCATVLISAVGAISYPKLVQFRGLENYTGKVFHTASWDHGYDYNGKRMAVIGNGCSAAQVVPSVVRDVAYLKQYARGAQWYHERPNQTISQAKRFAFKYIPGYNRLVRWSVFLAADSLAKLYGAGETSIKARGAVEDQAREYIYNNSPAKYHKFIAPDFPLGCKRRIWDPGYLASLWEENVELVPEGILEFHEHGIISESGVKDDFDVIVMATGFEVTEFLAPMEIFGAGGRSLRDQWNETGGPQAYYGCYVHDFPNFGMLFGPNTFPAHNSALFVIESGVDFITRTMLIPILDQKTTVVDVKSSSEDRFANRVQIKLQDSVYESGCSNWYINQAGRNVTSWPGYAATFYLETLFPHYEDFNTLPGSRFWRLVALKRWMKTGGSSTVLVACIVAFGYFQSRSGFSSFPGIKSVLQAMKLGVTTLSSRMLKLSSGS